VDETYASNWSSSNPAVFTLNSTTALLTAVGNGTAYASSQGPSECQQWWSPSPGTCTCNNYVSANGSAPCGVCGLSISSPSSNAVYNLGGANYNQATVPLEATSVCSGTASWSFNYTYTSAQPATYTASSSTSTTLNQSTNYTTPVRVGGQVTGSAQATVLGRSYSQSFTFYVLGTTISTISSRLLSLYSGTTYGLLYGIAYAESSYRQFSSSETRMGVTGYWPLGNVANQYTPADKQVGLMQVSNGMAPGFDWYTNTANGATVFQSSLSIASAYSSSEQKSYPKLPALAGTMLENEALSDYGGFSVHYYTPNATGTAWVGTTNTALQRMSTAFAGTHNDHGSAPVSSIRGVT